MWRVSLAAVLDTTLFEQMEVGHIEGAPVGFAGDGKLLTTGGSE